MRRRGRNGWRAHLAERPGGTLRLLAASAGVALLLVAIGLAWRGGGDAGRGAPAGGWTVSHWSDLLDDASARHGLDPALLRAVVLCESGGNPDAVSSAGAHGLMQIMPMTHKEAQRRFGMEAGDLFDPVHNVEVGSRYLAYLLERFDGDRRLAVAAYHMGPTRVARLLRENPQMSSERLVAAHAGPMTRAYVDKVLAAAG
ncbi:lytic transglycosylase domain-containing protein [Phycisphaera mikurensis]|uniref:Transglycosylase SLT domain-containing protein n=1 Tax=Phycisphaera mikurensis (strain NBRC 102666 / KCTC 22515 / FYK2301M01) TaxID=1142394 RepID=I0IAA9_PHYMF|nr:lytic transglycosylase domain-containing protein [Phycisphaera mikurensis]MBB6441803.1 soluble lytic murein transglycosylase-like protein [Phycisphaera mikurensis]BAM02197.1 hypothetical protein PSMK_00380 [Phycisphaera mikurensis NBRC 102666]